MSNHRNTVLRCPEPTPDGLNLGLNRGPDIRLNLGFNAGQKKSTARKPCNSKQR